jgi:uncharacterized protein (DUF608 family)
MLTIVVLTLGTMTAASAADMLKASQIKWDFETGDLQGWQVMPGSTFAKQPTNNDDDRWGDSFGKQGKWFIGTYEGAGDGAVGEIRSPQFIVDANKLSLLVGGGAWPGQTYVALCRASDGAELLTETGRNAEKMDRRIWDISPYKGQTLYIKIVDKATGGWGHINVDDIHALTPKEEVDIAQAKAEAKAAADRRLAAFRKSLHAPSERKVYRGDALKNVAMPMGGIGAGSIALCGDGALREWQIFNHVNKRELIPDSFFAIRAQVERDKPVAKVLQSAPVGNLPHVQATEFIGEYPIGFVRYIDRELPVQVSLESFSPMIPLNAHDSAIPGVLFVFTVKNPASRTASVSLLASLQNAVGYDGYTTVDGVKFAGYGGNANAVSRDGGVTTVQMTNTRLDRAAKAYGTMTLGAMSAEATPLVHWADAKDWWDDFAARGHLPDTAWAAPSEIGRTWNAALATPMTLKPGESKTATFFITWHFPNKYAEYDQNLAKYRLGNMYSNWYRDSSEAARYLAENCDRLSRETRLYHDTFYASALPYWFLDAVTSQSSIIRSQTCMWLEDGSFTAFEGCGGDTGCCPMNCTHVWNYEQSLSRLFPSLERNMRNIDLKVQETPEGLINHRTTLPLSLPRGSGDFIDGHMGTILKAYREHLMSPDNSFLDEYWPRIKLAMDYAIRTWDADGDGVIDGEQWNTYDCAVYGPNTFIGSLWLGALRASEEMAKLEGDAASARAYHDRFLKGSAKMDAELWNGEWWIQKYDAAKYKATQYGAGCMSDQLLGQWWAYMLDLGDLFLQPHIQTACRSMFKYNWMPDFTGFVQTQRTFAEGPEMGLLICSWPRGGRPAEPIYYRDEVWTGVEYSTAGLLLHEGMIDPAYSIVRGARNRYDGTKRNPWNEIECGDNYARAMSSYGLLLNAEGYFLDGPAKLLRFAPVIAPERFRGFFTVAEGWGSFSQERSEGSQRDMVEMKWGSLGLRTLELQLPPEARGKTVRASAQVGNRTVQVLLGQDGDGVRLRFRDGVEIKAGETLAVNLRW